MYIFYMNIYYILMSKSTTTRLGCIDYNPFSSG